VRWNAKKRGEKDCDEGEEMVGKKWLCYQTAFSAFLSAGCRQCTDK